MVAKGRVYNYRYEGDAKASRSDEYKLVKYYLLVMLVIYLLSSIWIFVFIFQQADWERNANLADAKTWEGVTTWTWWTVVSVIIADIFATVFLFKAVLSENVPLLLVFAVCAYVFAIFGLANRYLRGSIVCFVFPFTCATFALIQMFMQRSEDEEHELTKGLRLREGPAPTMENFLEHHEAMVERI